MYLSHLINGEKNSECLLQLLNPFDTKRYAQNEGFYVLTDGHVMKATAIAFDLELMKLLEVRGLPG